MRIDARELLALARTLIGFDTIRPGGSESGCARHLAGLLEEGGFDVSLVPMAPDRPNLVARSGRGARPPVCFSGHLDTVPLGAAPWSMDPFGGSVDGDRLFGRGASDMKAGVAAMVHAALALRSVGGDGADLLLVLTAGEESGCEGAAFLAAAGRLPGAGALVIGEPTENRPLLGHRGALWLEVETKGITAHGATPEQGVNAIYRAAEVVRRLEAFSFDAAAHPVMGRPTLNVGTIQGGININSVPDRAVMGVDIRTVPGQSHERVVRAVRDAAGGDADVRSLLSVAGLATDHRDPWVGSVFELVAQKTGVPAVPAAAPYFTDAAFLTPALGSPPTLILGPGEAAMAHKTDESCSIAAMEAAASIYFEIGRHWCCI